MYKQFFSFFSVLAATLAFQSDVSASSFLQAKVDDVPVVENKTGIIKTVAYIDKGQVFEIKRELSANWWAIKFGDEEAYVHKKYVDVLKTASISNKNIGYKNNGTFLTSKKASVYENVGGDLKEFAVLEKGIEYPFNKFEGNWYRVDFGGRIGWVHYSEVEEERNNITKGTPRYIEALENAPIVENKNGTIRTIGYIFKGQQYKVKRELSANWWAIQFGNEEAYIHKRYVKPVRTATYANHYNGQVQGLKTVIATNDTVIYDRKLNLRYPFAMLVEGMEYPVISEEGNWYKVSFGDRIGYVLKNKVRTNDQNKTEKYIKLKENAPIVDNRNGIIRTIGYLYKGQEFKIKKELSANWWTIYFGNGEAHIHKRYVEVIDKPSYKNTNENYVVSNNMIITKYDATVYDNSNGSLVPFAQINKGFRYPVISEEGNWYRVDIDGRIGFIAKHNTEVDKGIPVLMYHHLLKQETIDEFTQFQKNSAVNSVENFSKQMKWLYDNGYETITTKELESFIKGEINLPSKVVLITFDDGLKSVYLYGYPILKQYGMKATEFMITSRNLENETPFNPERYQFFSKGEMEKSKDVFEFQGHTNNLHDLENNTGVLILRDEDTILKDLSLNQKLLNARAFAYPYGHYNVNTIELAKKSGFRSGYTTKPGFANVGDDVMQIERMNIGQNMKLNEFIRIIEN